MSRSNLNTLLARHGLADPADAVIRRAQPGIQLLPAPRRRGSPGISKLGGLPDLPGGAGWPTRRGHPLSFIAQVNLAHLQSSAPDDRLPASGLLSFFYDLRAWGYDPRHRGCARVLYGRGDAAGLRRADPPPPRPPGSTEHHFQVFKECVIDFRRSPTLPPAWDFPEWDELTERQMEAYHDLQKQVGGPHRMLGHPHRIQGDMPLQCQLVSNGLSCADSSVHDDPRAKRLKKGVRQWRLLLQVDSDEENSDMMWGDAGMIYYWIREKDLRAARFERSWLILQCY